MLSWTDTVLLCAREDREAAEALAMLLEGAGYPLNAVYDDREGRELPLPLLTRYVRACLLCVGPSGESPWGAWDDLEEWIREEEATAAGTLQLGASAGERRGDLAEDPLVEESGPHTIAMLRVQLPETPEAIAWPPYLRGVRMIDLRQGFTGEGISHLLGALPSLDFGELQRRRGLALCGPDSSWTPSRSKPLRILMMTSEPENLPELQLEEALRTLRRCIQRTPAMRRVDIEISLAARVADLLSEFNLHEPHVFHFLGHGGRWETLLFQNPDQKKREVSSEGLEALIELFRDDLQLVYLDSCYSQYVAERIIEHVPCALGMRKQISNHAATIFGQAFYEALGSGRSVRRAYAHGLAALKLEQLDEHSVPQLLTRADIDPDHYVLLPDPET
ncbi:MAG: CHAT domain-containing protein [Acidobacteriota bacterium]